MLTLLAALALSPPPPAPPLAVSLVILRLTAGHGTTLVSNGIPLPPGAVRASDVDGLCVVAGGTVQPAHIEALAGARQDGSLRAVLVQFPFAATSYAQPATLGSDCPAQPLSGPGVVLTTMPEAVALPNDPGYLASTEVAGPLVTLSRTPLSPPSLRAMDADFATIGEQLWQRLGPDMHRGIAVYEHVLTTYQWWLRTGSVTWWVRATRMAAAYRDYVQAQGPRIAPWMVNTEGLAVAYWLTGDDSYRRAVQGMAAAMADQGRRGGPPAECCVSAYWIGGDLGDDRMRARILTAAIDAHDLGVASSGAYDSATSVHRMAADVLGSQHANGSFGGTHYLGGQKNYMVGMLLTALTRYYDDVRPDPRIPPAIKRALDYTWRTQWVPAAGAFRYISRPVAGEGGIDPVPALNGLILPGYGWYAHFSGDAIDRGRADLIVAGVRQARPDWLGFPLTFDQSFYRFFNYVAERP